MAIITRNEARNGIEISFDEKPSASIRTFLKSTVKARWHWKKKIWYCKYSETNMDLCEQAFA